MDRFNEDYWYNRWHTDIELHMKLGIRNATQISKTEPVSIYADTDSLFVSFKPAIDHCKWKNIIFNDEYLNNFDKKFIILSEENIETNNPNLVGKASNIIELEELQECMKIHLK